MRDIREVLIAKRKNLENGIRAEIDEKTILSVFYRTVFDKIRSLSREDIKDGYFKEGTVYIKSVHPLVSSEIWRKKKAIIRAANDILGKDVIRGVRAK